MPKISVVKSIVIGAPVERVYAVVRDFKQWQAWSPWLIAEPDAKVTCGDDGKSYAWSAGHMHARSKMFKMARSIDPFETYENDPAEVEDERDLVTVVRFPAKPG